MRIFKYEDTGGIHFASEEWIMVNYFPTWASRMSKLYREHMINRENCITDWVVENYAWEIECV